MLQRLRPAAVIGFGGYPTVPPVLAACWLGVPTLIHEQNGVLGRANRLLAPFVRAIATGFPGVLDSRPKLAAKGSRYWQSGAAGGGGGVEDSLCVAGNGAVQAGRIRRQSGRAGDGRRGARGHRTSCRMTVRARLAIVQQARDEDLVRVRDTYARLSVAAEVEPFFSDMPARIAAGHLVVSRAGASTVAELAAIGRPGILVPLPHALDQDQAANAAVLGKVGGAIPVRQSEFTPKWLAAEIAHPRVRAEAACGHGRSGPADRRHRRGGPVG